LNTFNNAVLTVPFGTFEIYKNTNYWNKFVNIRLSTVDMEIDADGEGYTAEASSTGYTTGITMLTTDLSVPADVYNLNGHLVSRQTTSLKNLPSGIYIVNGKKMVLK